MVRSWELEFLVELVVECGLFSGVLTCRRMTALLGLGSMPVRLGEVLDSVLNWAERVSEELCQ